MARSVRILRLFVITIVFFAAGAGVAWYAGLFGQTAPPFRANSIIVIAPYRHVGTWVFDDERAGLYREPFVGGVPEMIDELVRDIPDAESGFRLFFSPWPFPGHTHKLAWQRGDETGNWYYCEKLEMEGWLCPALFKYYPEPPVTSYVKAEPK